MVLAVNGHPLSGHDTGKETQFQMHQIADRRVQIQTAMALGAVQINSGEKDRYLKNCYSDRQHPE
jgi:hypothetical protein